MNITDIQKPAQATSPILAALDNLQKAEAAYRVAHDSLGHTSREAGHAWFVLRSAGDAARKLIADQGNGVSANSDA